MTRITTYASTSHLKLRPSAKQRAQPQPAQLFSSKKIKTIDPFTNSEMDTFHRTQSMDRNKSSSTTQHYAFQFFTVIAANEKQFFPKQKSRLSRPLNSREIKTLKKLKPSVDLDRCFRVMIPKHLLTGTTSQYFNLSTQKILPYLEWREPTKAIASPRPPPREKQYKHPPTIRKPVLSSEHPLELTLEPLIETDEPEPLEKEVKATTPKKSRKSWL